METYDQPLVFEQPLESGRFDALLQKLQSSVSGLIGLFRKNIPGSAKSASELEESPPGETVENAESIPVHEKMSSLDIPEDVSNELDSIRKLLLDRFGLPTCDATDNFIIGVMLKSNGDPKMLEKLLLKELTINNALLRKAIFKCAKLTRKVELHNKELTDLSKIFRSRIFQAVENDRAVNLMESIKNNETVIDFARANEDEAKITRKRRHEALTNVAKIKEYAEVINSWDENPCSLSDSQMREIFERETADNRFLTTFFDTAQFGLVNRFLEKHASKIDKENPDFDDFVKSCKTSIIEHFEPLGSIAAKKERRFAPENCIFTRNGMGAFRFFYDNYLKDGDSVLTTSEEYGEITHIMGPDEKKKDKKDVQLNAMPPYEDKENYLRDFANMLSQNPGINYILVSTVSRRGTVFPLKEMNEIRKQVGAETGRHIHLVADACQAVGRRVINFNDFEPDVFIGSSQKGTDFGGPVGFLALSSDFIREKGEFEYDEAGNKSIPYLKDSNKEEIGTLNKTDMARFTWGLKPELIGSLKIQGMKDKDKVINKLLLSVEERQKANHNLACKFAHLARAINKRTKGRFKVLYPAMIYGPNGTLNEDRLSNIFECRIKGLKRHNKNYDNDKKPDVIHTAQSFGVTISDFYDEAEEGVSFRIALHPFMSNNSLRILGYALHECCVQAQEQDREKREEQRGKNAVTLN
jgi:selenocysteine lyase/cysteine desulfurase